MSIALGYGRKSVVRRKTDEIGVDKQRLAIQRLAEDRGYDLDWYEDAQGHRSGRFEKTRPNYIRLLKRLEADPPPASVIFYELDRAGRSVIIIDKIVKLCQARGITLISIRDGIDTSRGIDANLTSQIQMRAGFSEYYANQVSDLMKSTSAYYRDELLSPWGMWPFGFARVGEGKEARFLPHEKHAATTRTVLAWYATGLSYDGVAQKANDAQMRHEGRDHLPKRFTREAIRSIVGNILFYAGCTVTGRRVRSKDNRIILTGEGSCLERYARAMNAVRSPAVEPLIDDAQANAVIERRYRNQTAGRAPVDWVALLTPLAYWHDKKLRAETNHGVHYYRVRSQIGPYINGDAVDAELIQRIGGIQFPPELREIIRRGVVTRVGDAQKAKAQGNIERLSRQMEVLADLLLDDKIQREAYNRRYAELERGLRDARLELAREDDVDRLMMTLTDLSSAFQLMRPVNRKRALAKLFEKIEFDDEGQIQRLHLRPWARQAWGEIVFAYRLHARSFQANSAPGERMAQIWPEGMAWWLERAA